MSRSADAAVTGVVLVLLRLILVWGGILLCGAVLIPYTVETWFAWFGHCIVVEWWKGLLIGIIVGFILRRGVIWLAVSTALVTWVFAFFGFTGF